MSGFDWDLLEKVARETGQAIRLGVFGEFSVAEKRLMSQEARKRKMNITMGNSKRNSNERDDELYVMKKL